MHEACLPRWALEYRRLLQRILDEQCIVSTTGDDCGVTVKEPKQSSRLDVDEQDDNNNNNKSNDQCIDDNTDNDNNGNNMIQQQHQIQLMTEKNFILMDLHLYMPENSTRKMLLMLGLEAKLAEISVGYGSA